MCRRDNLFVIKYNETYETIIIVPVLNLWDVDMGSELPVMLGDRGIVSFFNDVNLIFKNNDHFRFKSEHKLQF